MEDSKNASFVNSQHPKRWLVVVLSGLFILAICLIIAIVFLRFLGGSDNNVSDEILSCDEKSAIFDPQRCYEDVSVEVTKICEESETMESCRANGLEVINSRIEKMITQPKLKNSLAALRVSFCADYDMPQEAIEYAEAVDEAELTDEQKFLFYSGLGAAYYGVDDRENGEIYSAKSIEFLTEEMMKEYQMGG